MLISPRQSDLRRSVIQPVRGPRALDSRRVESVLVALFALLLVAMLVTHWMPLVWVAGAVGTAAMGAELRDMMRG